jgi:hypothetical protein
MKKPAKKSHSGAEQTSSEIEVSLSTDLEGNNATSLEDINNTSLDTSSVDDPSNGSAILDEPSMPVQVTRPVRIVVAAVAFAVLGASAGLGFILLGKSETVAPESSIVNPVPLPEADGIGESQRIKSDDALRDWNIEAAGYISPLISQLARAPRTTLGGQIALCKEQRAILQPVLDLVSPPNTAVSPSFDRWRSALRAALDGCVERRPTGEDAADIERITREVADTEALFATFLRAQLPFVDVAFEANPELFEKP